MRKIRPENWTPAPKEYVGKPKAAPKLKIIRECNLCLRSFIADGKFNRKCDSCKKLEGYSHGW